MSLGASGPPVIFTAVWFTKIAFLWYNLLGCLVVISDMATIPIPPSIAPVPEPEASQSDNKGNGMGTGPGDPSYDQRENLPPDQSPSSSSYRLFLIFAMVWIVALFGTLTCALEWRWVHSNDWVAIPLPHILYVNTALLLLSSLSFEFARRSLRSSDRRHTFHWLLATVLLAIAFVGGQITAWWELGLQGLGLASNPGSCFFYVITGAHLVLLLPGIVSLAALVFFFGQSPGQQSAMDVTALYWNFMDGLWLCLAVLLFVTIQ